MASLIDPALDPMRRRAEALGTALQCHERTLFAETVLAMRADLQRLAQGDGASDDRLARLSQGLRQIDRAARAGNTEQARQALAQWRRAL